MITGSAVFVAGLYPFRRPLCPHTGHLIRLVVRPDGVEKADGGIQRPVRIGLRKQFLVRPIAADLLQLYHVCPCGFGPSDRESKHLRPHEIRQIEQRRDVPLAETLLLQFGVIHHEFGEALVQAQPVDADFPLHVRPQRLEQQVHRVADLRATVAVGFVHILTSYAAEPDPGPRLTERVAGTLEGSAARTATIPPGPAPRNPLPTSPRAIALENGRCPLRADSPPNRAK